MKIILFSILAYSLSLFADTHSMRNCVVLPVTDTAGNSLGHEVYEEVEYYLKEKSWCNYRSNADLIEIFSKYRESLRMHLEDPNVLRTVADRMQAGTLIRVDISYDVNQAKVKLDVIGDNGKDVYFSETTILAEVNIQTVITTIKNWLEIYEASIPYHGRVLGILGDQVTFTIPKHLKLKVGQDIRIRRYVGKTRHPLLKKVVEWDTDLIARGKIKSISNGQALGLIKVYERGDKVKLGDWVKIDKFIPATNISANADKVNDIENQFGKLGFFTLYFDFDSSSVGTNTSDNNKVAGFIYGFSAQVEAWITREYFLVGEFARRLGSLKEESGSPGLSTVDYTNGVIRIGGGYKHLPLGFFFGPQINLYGGYAIYSYNVEESASDGFGSNSISGFFIGVGGNMPLQKGIRLFGSAEFIPFPSFEDEDDIFGSNKSAESLVFRAGVKYQFSPLITIDGAFEVQNNSAKFSNGNTSQVSYKDSIIRVGGSFIF
jgi:hypothetical protein